HRRIPRPVVNLDLNPFDRRTPRRTDDAVVIARTSDARRRGFKPGPSDGGFHPHGLTVVIFLAKRDIVAPHELVLEALVTNLDALEPFRVRDPIPAGGYQPQRETVVRRQGSLRSFRSKGCFSDQWRRRATC